MTIVNIAMCVFDDKHERNELPGKLFKQVVSLVAAPEDLWVAERAGRGAMRKNVPQVILSLDHTWGRQSTSWVLFMCSHLPALFACSLHIFACYWFQSSFSPSCFSQATLSLSNATTPKPGCLDKLQSAAFPVPQTNIIPCSLFLLINMIIWSGFIFHVNMVTIW